MATSRSESIIRASLWLAFLGLPIRAFGADNDLTRNAGRFAIDIAGALLVLVGLFSLQGARRAPLRGSVPLHAMLAACALAAGVGLARGNGILYWVLMGLLPFMSMLVVFALRQYPEFRERLLSTLVQQTLIATIFAAYVIIFIPIPSRGVWNGEGGDGMGKLASRSLYALPFLLGSLSRLKSWQIWLAVGGWLELTVLGVLGASRGIITVTFVLLPFLLTVVLLRTRAPMRRLIAPLAAAAILLVIAVGALDASGRAEEVRTYAGGRWEQTVNRLTGVAPEDLTMSIASMGAIDSAKHEFLEGESRGGELLDFLSQMEPPDYLVGRGFGAHWMSSYWGMEWLMVHIGPGHLLLVGGLPLLLSFVWLLGAAGFAAWRRLSHHATMAGAFLYLAIFVQNFLQHGAMQDEIEVYFFWICVGLVLTEPIHKWSAQGVPHWRACRSLEPTTPVSAR